MQKKEIKLDDTNFQYHSEDAAVYRVGNDRIRLFSTLEGFITEDVCFKLSKVETERILLPKYPVYQEGEYCGCATPWRDKDWIQSFYKDGFSLKDSLIRIKQDLRMLSALGYDMVDMPYYCSNGDRGILTFDGAIRILESRLEKQALWNHNYLLFQDYLRGLIYNAMGEFGVEPDFVVQYLYPKEEKIDERVFAILDSKRSAGYLIRDDIHEKVLK